MQSRTALLVCELKGESSLLSCKAMRRTKQATYRNFLSVVTFTHETRHSCRPELTGRFPVNYSYCSNATCGVPGGCVFLEVRYPLPMYQVRRKT